MNKHVVGGGAWFIYVMPIRGEFVVHSDATNEELMAQLADEDVEVFSHLPSQDWFEHVRTLWKSPVHFMTRRVMEFYFGSQCKSAE